MTYRLSTLLLVMALVGVLLGLFLANPLLGIGLLYLVVPAWIRTAQHTAAAHRSVTASEKVSVFLSSMLRMAVVLIAAIASLVGVLLLGCGAGSLLMGLGLETLGKLLIGLTLFASLMTALWAGNRVGNRVWVLQPGAPMLKSPARDSAAR